MQRHVFDMSESATHELVAKQLRDLANQFEAGSMELAYDESHAPTGIVDPVDVVLDLTQNRNHVEMVIRISWRTVRSV
jgi:amphi-Trp domain-containing protein